jgi:hypothetical protein
MNELSFGLNKKMAKKEKKKKERKKEKKCYLYMYKIDSNLFNNLSSSIKVQLN